MMPVSQNPDVAVDATGRPVITVRPLPRSNVPSLGSGDGEALGSAFGSALAPPDMDADASGLEGGASVGIQNAVAHDNDLESAVVELATRRRAQEARGFLDATAKPPKQKPAEKPSPAEDVEQESNAQPGASTSGLEGGASAGATEKPSFIGSIVKDISRGAVEAPLQILGGIRDAAQSTMDLASWLQDNHPAIATAIATAAGPAAVAASQANAAAKPQLPNIKQPKTETGAIVRGVAQFLAGFAAGGPAGEAIGATLGGGKLAAAAVPMVKGAWSDFSAFEGHDQKLSDLIQQFPALKNPVTEFLSSKPDDGEAAGRFKRAVEGLGLGVVAEGFVRALRFLRDVHRGRESAKAVGADNPPVPPANPPARGQDLLGDDAAPLIETIENPDVGVPSDVAAKGVSQAAQDQREIAAGDRRFRKGMERLGDSDIYINFARIETGDDVKRVIQDTAAAFKDDIDAARRGTRSHEQTSAAAYETDAWQALMDRRDGAPLNAEQTVAARRLWEASARKLLDVADAAVASPSPENLFAFRKMLAIHATIQREVIAARTETGRALDAWKIEARGGKERMAAIESLLDTFGGAENSELLAREIASVRNLPERLGVMADMADRSALARSFGVIKEVYTNALLSNPITHVKVIASNALMQGLDMIERASAAGWSKYIGSGEVSPTEAAASFVARSMALKEAWLLADKAFRVGQSQFGVKMMQYADFGFRREITADNWKLASGQWRDPKNWLGNAVDALGAAVNWPGRMVGSQDDFFKMIGYRGEVAARAFRRASEEVADGTITREQMSDRVAGIMRDPPPDIHQAAVDHARYLNFTADPGDFVKAINRVERRWAEGHVGQQLGAAFMRFLLPFRSTPAQITWAALERSPLAPLMGRYKEAIAAGGAAADIARTKMALGSMALMTTLDLALDGHITGGGPRNRDERGTRQTLMRSGWQPYSLRLPDGVSDKTGEQKFRYFSYNQLDPFGMHLGMAADLAEVINNTDHINRDKQESILRVAAATAFSFANNILDKTWMTGMAQLLRALDQPDEAGRYVESETAGYTGAGMRWARRLIDPTIRYTHDLVSEIKNRTPGLSSELPPARDYWGRVRTYQSGMGTIYDAIMPMASRVYDPEPIDKEALANGFNMMAPNMTLNMGGKYLYLANHPEFFSRFLEIRGQMKPTDMPGGRTPYAPDGSALPLRSRAEVQSLPLKELSYPEICLRKYGDVSLLDLLNGIVTQQNDELSPIYDEASGGHGGGKETMIKHIVADYGRAAKWAMISESALLKEKMGKPSPKDDQ